jgi:O-methyltransferase
MKENLHPSGNLKIKLAKISAKLVSNIILFILSVFFKINKKNSEVIISSAFFAPWKDDKKFKNFYSKISDTTILDTKRLYTLWFLSNNLKKVNADILDVGCLKGGAGFAMSKASKNGKVYLIDTFEGLIEDDHYHSKKHFIFKDINFVKKKIKELGLKKTSVHKLNFPSRANKIIKKSKIKLCHLDVNTFNSTKKSFNFVKKKLIKNGIIVFDDYGIHNAISVKKFVDQLIKKDNNFTFVNNYMGQCILIKK